MSDEDTALGEAADAVEAASNTKALDVVARSGFAVMALLHIVIGAIAIALALGQPGQAEPTGAIEQLAANPWGPAVMWACLVGCAGLSLWQLSEATLRARHLPAGKRLGKLISSGFLAVAYASVGLSFAGFAVGMRGDSGDSTQDFSTALVREPFGVPALIALGLTVIGVGIYFIVKGIRKQFKDELHHFEGTRKGRPMAVHLSSLAGAARFSRSLGLPAPFPDILGLALRLPDGGRPADLLFPTTGLSVPGRKRHMGADPQLRPSRRPVAAVRHGDCGGRTGPQGHRVPIRSRTQVRTRAAAPAGFGTSASAPTQEESEH